VIHKDDARLTDDGTLRKAKIGMDLPLDGCGLMSQANVLVLRNERFE
jgi:hypothetical protein